MNYKTIYAKIAKEEKIKGNAIEDEEALYLKGRIRDYEEFNYKFAEYLKEYRKNRIWKVK